MVHVPSFNEIVEARRQLDDVLIDTPIMRFRSPEIAALVGSETSVVLKLELMQIAGSFKSRAATLAVRSLSSEASARGVVTASGGNHAIAVAAAARAVGARARVFMPRTANAFRKERCRALGADIHLVESVHEAFAAANSAAEAEALTYIHAFEGPLVALGTATLGFDFLSQAPDLDAIIVPVGGGGLAAGVAACVKQIRPSCRVYGVEPIGADTMRRSFDAGSPQSLDKVTTIADSLGAPSALPYSFALCRRFVDDLVLVSDDQLRFAMRFMFAHLKLSAEPAAAAAMAALLGPLRGALQGKRVGLIVCGSNIDAESFSAHLAAAPDSPN